MGHAATVFRHGVPVSAPKAKQACFGRGGSGAVTLTHSSREHQTRLQDRRHITPEGAPSGRLPCCIVRAGGAPAATLPRGPLWGLFGGPPAARGRSGPRKVATMSARRSPECEPNSGSTAGRSKKGPLPWCGKADTACMPSYCPGSGFTPPRCKGSTARHEGSRGDGGPAPQPARSPAASWHQPP